jgi:hypothetical protein
MTDNRPAPLTDAEIDIRGLAGFMLNVDRLLASELVAIGSPEECWAAVMLWCRAWQQVPPASLPNDDKILASFSGARERWPQVRAMALRGFIECSDGRLYHPVLAEEARKAWKKRQKYRRDQERLKKWRVGQHSAPGTAEPDGETHFKTHSERVLIREETGTGTGTETNKNKRSAPQATMDYAFRGEVLKVTQEHFTQWHTDFDTYPDLMAEVANIDAKFAAMPKPPGNPFIAAGKWLKKGHEGNLKRGWTRRAGNAEPELDGGQEPWRRRIKGFIERKFWIDHWGYPPTDPSCACPRHILAEFRDQLTAGTAQ